MARSPLDRDRIVDAALAAVDAGGALTTRAIAAELGVTAMALYRHFPSLEVLQEAVFDRVVADARITEHEEPVVAVWLGTTFERVYAALVERGALFPVLGTHATLGPAAREVMRATLARLRDHGQSGERANAAFHTLLAFTVGAAALDAGLRKQPTARPALPFGGRARFETELRVVISAVLAG